jgi:hypothetical protein
LIGLIVGYDDRWLAGSAGRLAESAESSPLVESVLTGTAFNLALPTLPTLTSSSNDLSSFNEPTEPDICLSVKLHPVAPALSLCSLSGCSYI